MLYKSISSQPFFRVPAPQPSGPINFLTAGDSTTPMTMRYHWLSIQSFLTVAHLTGLVASLASPWDDMRVKHAWKAVPDNWESLGPPHPETTIDLFVALKSQNENALTDALYEVSTPGNPKYILSNTPTCSMYLYMPVSPWQIWRTPLKGGGR